MFGLTHHRHLMQAPGWMPRRVTEHTDMPMRQPRHIAHMDKPSRRLQAPTDDTEQAAFARAIGPDNGTALAGRHNHFDVLQQVHTLRGAQAHPVQPYRCAGRVVRQAEPGRDSMGRSRRRRSGL